MGVVLWIVIGIAAGSVARLAMPGPKAGGIGVAIAVGVVAALIGGLIGSALPDGTSTAIDIRPVLIAINSTLIALFSYRCLAIRAMA